MDISMDILMDISNGYMDGYMDAYKDGYKDGYMDEYMELAENSLGSFSCSLQKTPRGVFRKRLRKIINPSNSLR